MYWRWESLPEVKVLPPEEVEGVLRAARPGWRSRSRLLWMLMLAAVVGVWLVVIVTLPKRSAWREVSPFGLAAVVVAINHFYYASQRGRLRQYVQANLPEVCGTHCLRCEYDLRHTAGDTCPECGEPIPRPAAPEPARSADG